MLITLKDYAEKYNRTRDQIYTKWRLGFFKTAKKYGRTILIDSDEPLPVCRIKSGETFPFPIYRMRELKKRGEVVPVGDDNNP